MDFADVTMRDGRVDVSDGSKKTVTIDTHRHGLVWVRVQGAFFKGRHCWVLSADNRATPCLACRFGRCFYRLTSAEVATGDPHPLGERNSIF